MIRTCTKCGTTKELNDKNFCPSKRCAEGLTRICRECGNAYRNGWALGDRTEFQQAHRVYEFAREMKKYGTTVEWYRDKLIEQSGVCVLCEHLSHHHGTIQRLQVDHSHACCDLRTKSCGKCLRGLLCADCNIRLAPVEAVLKEGTIVPKAGTWLDRALQYLDSYRIQ